MNASRERRLQVGGLSLRVLIDEPGQSSRRETSRAPVVVLHGFTGDAGTMEGAARALAMDRRVVRVDLIGHGRSDAPQGRAPYAMLACLEQLAELCEQLSLDRPHWLGYSMGGRTALCMAAHHPKIVRSLMLIGASAGLESAAARAERVAADEALARRIEGSASADDDSGNGQGLEAFVDHWMALPLFASQKRLGDAALARARAQRLENSPRGLANSLRGMGTGAQPALHDRLAKIDVPVALFVGDEDAKFLAIAAELGASLPRARVVRLAEAGHAAHLENPEDFGREARRFALEADEWERT